MSTDIVFSLDTTGSMYPAITELRREVESTIKRLFSTVDNLRVGLVAHGDYLDNPYETKTISLTSNVSQLINFIRTVETTNGYGNGGECYGRAMSIARGMDWRADNRVFVLIGDENVHGKGANILTGDRQRYTVLDDWRYELNTMRQLGISQYLVKCLNHSKSRHFHAEFPKLAGTPLLHLAQFADIEKIITALTFKAQNNDLVLAYGNELEQSGQLNRNTAHILNLLLDAENLIGGIDFAQQVETTDSGDLAPVPPWRFQVLHVDRAVDIQSFVVSSGANFRKGRGFYELTKSELVQEHKEVVLQSDKGDLYSGKRARDMIGLPFGQRGTITPHNVPRGYTAFIQSTSNNRKLMRNTRFLYEAT
jgi:von Willebrand factor type A domain